MKVGDNVPVTISGQVVGNATVRELGDGTATLVVPAMLVVMATRTELTVNTPVSSDTETIVTGVEGPVQPQEVTAPTAVGGTPEPEVVESQPQAQTTPEAVQTTPVEQAVETPPTTETTEQ